MQSFFKLIILKKSGKYSDKVRLPKYKKAEELSICTIQGRSCRIQKDGRVAIGLTKEFREKLYSEIERAYAEAKEKQQEQAKEQSQKQGKEQSQDKDGFMKASGEPLPFR